MLGNARECQGNVWEWVKTARGMQGNAGECRGMQGNAGGTYGSGCIVPGECRELPGECKGPSVKC